MTSILLVLPVFSCFNQQTLFGNLQEPLTKCWQISVISWSSLLWFLRFQLFSNCSSQSEQLIEELSVCSFFKCAVKLDFVVKSLSQISQEKVEFFFFMLCLRFMRAFMLLVLDVLKLHISHSYLSDSSHICFFILMVSEVPLGAESLWALVTCKKWAVSIICIMLITLMLAQCLFIEPLEITFSTIPSF